MAVICQCPSCGAQAPREEFKKVRADRAPQPRVSKPPAKPNTRSKMWQSMRVLRKFTAPEISAASESELRPARSYINALIEAGYVHITRVSSGEVGDFTSYQIARDTGPHAPRLRAGNEAIFDPNTNQEVRRVHRAR